MSVKCGNHRNENVYHETVADVRNCYGGKAAQPDHSSTARQFGAPATDRQRKFLNTLLTERGKDQLGPQDANMTKQQASAMIDSLLKTPKQSKDSDGWQDHGSMAGSFTSAGDPAVSTARRGLRETPGTQFAYPDVPAGHYAVPSATGNNDLDFFRVDRPTDGRWAGRTFVKRVVGGRPSYPVRGWFAVDALNAIVREGIDAAGTLYGQKIGKCRWCNRHLTKYASRQLSFGRTCGEDHGLLTLWDETQANRPEGVE